MPTLSVTNFSCLRKAEFSPAAITIVIGRQGSGKSLTTKLFYFCSELMTSFLRSAERGENFERFKRSVSEQFNTWFPASAWGPHRFNITYSAEPFTVRILRRQSHGVVADTVVVSFSRWFRDFYNDAVKFFEKTDISEDDEVESLERDKVVFDRSWEIRETLIRRLHAEMRDSYVPQQTFIPAGRAFFTSIGRLVAALEQAGSLDPVTIRFARLFATIRDTQARRSFSTRNNIDEQYVAERDAFMQHFFGGQVIFESESEYVEANDGKKIPFGSLSSGQQELIPIWSIIDYLSAREHMFSRTVGSRTRRNIARAIIYIEEPEAHLFPSAQSLFMEFLIGSRSIRDRRRLIITTHSPYIMSKLNVFLKAGALSRHKKLTQDIQEVVKRDCWLTPDDIAAYAIEDGELRQLIDEDELIDATYLDGISEEIGEQFSRLLEIEVEA